MDPNSIDDDNYDPEYQIEGIQIKIHYLQGFIQDNKIRIAITLQIGKWVIKDESGALCFWAGKGHGDQFKIMKDGSTKKKIKTVDENLDDDEETKRKKVLENLQASLGDRVMVIDDKPSSLEEEIKKKAK